jgi:2-isopropylmalate synthase
MNTKKIYIYDTTLRDGTQTEGISLSVEDKVQIALKLDDFGVDYIEGGWPGSNPKDEEFFKRMAKAKLKNSCVVAFGSTRRAHVHAEKDANLLALLEAKTKAVAIFGKSSVFQAKEILKTTPEENLHMIFDSVHFLAKKGVEVIYDAEHFFDGYKSDPDYALRTLQEAQKAGARVAVLCDTNGGTVTGELVEIVKKVKAALDIPVGIHTHNDSEMAVANSIAAVQAGAAHVQGTINGYGERCGNANLCSIIPALQLKLGYTCMAKEHLKKLTELSRFVAEVCNMKQSDNQPFVGSSAFSHKGGVHINAVLKNPRSYEHVEPEEVGNKRKLLISELSGKTSIVLKAKGLSLDLEKDSPKTKHIHTLIQSLEHEGYQFELAEASFELLLHRNLNAYKKFFDFESFRVIIEKTKDALLSSEATLRLLVKGEKTHTVSLGDGPVNALDNALRKALVEFYPSLEEMKLTDFKVRIIDEKSGTAAKVRVLIESKDKQDSWWTVGLSENIIEASWQALVDSVEYKLLKDKIKP